MAQQSVNFTTAKLNVSERGILGKRSGKPVVKLKMGMALARILYEYAGTGLSIDELDTDKPSVALSPLNVQTGYTIAAGLTSTAFAVDPDVTANINYLSDVMDDMDCTVIAIDGTYSSGTVACPEIKAWCEALGGTYATELGA
jgi:hypothetical protein